MLDFKAEWRSYKQKDMVLLSQEMRDYGSKMINFEYDKFVWFYIVYIVACLRYCNIL